MKLAIRVASAFLLAGTSEGSDVIENRTSFLGKPKNPNQAYFEKCKKEALGHLKQSPFLALPNLFMELNKNPDIKAQLAKTNLDIASREFNAKYSDNIEKLKQWINSLYWYEGYGINTKNLPR